MSDTCELFLPLSMFSLAVTTYTYRGNAQQKITFNFSLLSSRVISIVADVESEGQEGVEGHYIRYPSIPVS